MKVLAKQLLDSLPGIKRKTPMEERSWKNVRDNSKSVYLCQISDMATHGKNDGYAWTDGKENEYMESQYDTHGVTVGTFSEQYDDPRAKAFLSDKKIVDEFAKQHPEYKFDLEGQKFDLILIISEK